MMISGILSPSRSASTGEIGEPCPTTGRMRVETIPIGKPGRNGPPGALLPRPSIA
jgi:hypothetical protein